MGQGLVLEVKGYIHVYSHKAHINGCVTDRNSAVRSEKYIADLYTVSLSSFPLPCLFG